MFYDQHFREPVCPLPSSMSYNGSGEIALPPQPQHLPNTGARRRQQPYVRIIEQPASKALRFRYECESRFAGSIPGASSTPEYKTYPEIEVVGYKGKAVVVVFCVMKDPPYTVHPHNLVGKEGCKNGFCTLPIPADTMRVRFSKLAIQCVKKKDIKSSLKLKEKYNVDYFRQHFAPQNELSSIDLNAVRLCFQVLIEGDTPGKYRYPLTPVVSNIIYDKKAVSDLTIVKLSSRVGYVDIPKNIILVCDKVAKDDIEIHFFEMKNDEIVWSAKADFLQHQVHKHHAIWFKTPRYKTLDVTESVKVFIQLYRPSDQATSEPLPFELLPANSVDDHFKRKRARLDHTDVMNQLTDQDRMAMEQTLQTPLIEPINIEPLAFMNDRPSCSTWHIPENSSTNMFRQHATSSDGNCIGNFDSHHISSAQAGNTINDMTILPGFFE
ncbi:embryonic polarity protein dorsal-like [Sitophilus oryzae]|uniref:Embryonic polarity protein dorsal-like n=1 Tax=Sitophilus oryzae TaxID=7048 RepID=A0A6J2YHW9_SITOR|nr:embryonic polarity protein dorsal-like [Sitophilus oryzae]XP_030763618.1 embryonic polarity protein dorsal-like [Sitophilus oryzae]